MKRLNNKVIVVTGGSGLLGKTFIRKIEDEGGRAISIDIRLLESGINHQYQCDILDKKQLQDTVSQIIQDHHKIDGWINNAYPRTEDWGNKWENIELDSWRSNVDMHMNGYFLGCQSISEIMKKQKSGVIINMSSIYGFLAPDFSIYEGTSMTMPAAYSAIKAGIINLSRYLASYLGEYNIRVNAVSPGGIWDNQPESFVKNYELRTPLKRMGKPEDISPMVAFLLSDEATYITGQNIVIDGGWSVK